MEKRMWKVTVAEAVDQTIRSLDAATRQRIAERLRQMQVNPYAVLRPMLGWNDLWSCRIDGWRITCAIGEDVKVLAVCRLPGEDRLEMTAEGGTHE